MAKRSALAVNWDEAAKLWQQETINTKAKIKARAYYNMAISNEINGNLYAAMDWAQKPYVLSGKNLALECIDILKIENFKWIA